MSDPGVCQQEITSCLQLPRNQWIQGVAPGAPMSPCCLQLGLGPTIPLQVALQGHKPGGPLHLSSSSSSSCNMVQGQMQQCCPISCATAVQPAASQRTQGVLDSCCSCRSHPLGPPSSCLSSCLTRHMGEHSDSRCLSSWWD